MDGLKRSTVQTAENASGSADSDVYAPASVSDVLYLIATQRADRLEPGTAQELSRANICFIRGDLPAALSSVDAVLAGLDATRPAYGDIYAFRVVLMCALGQDPAHPAHTGPAAHSTALPSVQLPSQATEFVSLCVESNQHWNSGSLFQGLLLNRSAIVHSHDGVPVWRMFAHLLLARKLSDIHVFQQASRMLTEAQSLMHDSGLLAFESAVEAIHAVLYLHRGHFDSALLSATATLHIAERRVTTIGVKLALSVAAMARLGLGDRDGAAATLASFAEQRAHYVPPDSVTRTTYTRIALLAAAEGPRAAAGLAHADWQLLGTGSASFIEEVTRPAWLVALAQRADDAELAKRALAAIERLAGNNPEVPVLETAADHARRAFSGEQPRPSSTLDLACFPRRSRRPAPAGTPRAHDFAPEPQPQPHAPVLDGLLPQTPVPFRIVPDVSLLDDTPAPDLPGHPREPHPRPHPAPPAAAPAPGCSAPAHLPPLSRREDEIARLVGGGMTNKQVAKLLGLSPHTVNFHLRSIFRKFSISTRVKLGCLVAQLDQRPSPPAQPAARRQGTARTEQERKPR